MANTVDKVLKIAEAEVGYCEKSRSAYKKDPSCLDSKTKGAGSDNYTKYGRDMHKVYPAVMDFPAYWCDAFVDWCFYKAYGEANARGLLGGNFDDYTVASAQLYKNKGALNTTPKKGAQVFFTRNGQVSGCHHTGIVYKVDGSYFYTIEGNTSGASGVVRNGGGVAKKKYSISEYKGSVIFGHPKYDKEYSGKKDSPKKDGKPSSSVSASTSSGYSKKDFVRDVQRCLGVTIDGIAGPKTLKATVTVSKKKNPKHKVVKYIQKRLKALGYTAVGSADGIAGDKFTKAVNEYQKKVLKYSSVDGEVTARGRMWKSLLGM